MGKFLSWVLILAFIGILAYGGYGVYTALVPAVVQTNTGPLQTVKLATGTIDAAVGASGTLRSNQSAAMTWNASGKVAKINVKIGDSVKAGDVLATLDTPSLPANVLLAMVDIAMAKQSLADLLNTQSTLPAAEKAVIDAQKAIDTAQNHRDNMSYPTRGNPEQIANAGARYLRAAQMVDFTRAMYDRLPGDPTDNHAKAEALTNLQKAKDARDLALSTLNWYKGFWKPDEIAAADSALVVAKANLAQAQADLATVKLGPDPHTVAADQRRIDADQALIDTQNLVAPIDGVITVLDNKVGDLVSNGDSSLRIDDITAYYVNLEVSEVDIARVRVGQPATLTFDAIPNKTYTGAVTAVAPVGTTTNGVVNFTVTVRISNLDSKLRPGITSATSIVVDSAAQVLVVPTKAVKTVGGQNVVYVLSSVPAGTTPGPGTLALSKTGTISPPAAGETEIVIPVVVKTGVSSDTSVEIVSTRLRVGDLIVLNPPASALNAAAVGN